MLQECTRSAGHWDDSNTMRCGPNITSFEEPRKQDVGYLLMIRPILQLVAHHSFVVLLPVQPSLCNASFVCGWRGVVRREEDRKFVCTSNVVRSDHIVFARPQNRDGDDDVPHIRPIPTGPAWRLPHQYPRQDPFRRDWLSPYPMSSIIPEMNRSLLLKLNPHSPNV